MPQVVIVGAGPTGATLAFLLVKRGITVTLVEAAKDFYRVFRGEGLMPSGLNALTQMGIEPILQQVPHRSLHAWEFIFNNQSMFRVEEPMGASQPCTLVSQPPLLEALVAAAQQHTEFELIQGVPVKGLLRRNDRIAGVQLADGREIFADLVVGADGRSSVIRQRADLKLVKQPQSIDVLWFKLPAHPRFVQENVFYSILNRNHIFSVFHGAEAGQLHLAWVLSANDHTAVKTDWAETFAALSPDWLADHFRSCAEQIESPLRLSVLVGRCPQWYQPGLILLGDAAHPMSPVRAQGINLALRDVIVAANHLVPWLQADNSANNSKEIDAALPRIQAEREREIIRAQQLQAQEASQGERLQHHPLLRSLVVQSAPLTRNLMRAIWTKRQQEMRQGITSVELRV